MARNSNFAAFVAARWPTPESALVEFFDGAVAAAAEVGAKLTRAPVLDGRRVYLPALSGRRDQRQFVRGSIQTMDDGTRWPSLTFFSFRDGSRSVFWSPRDDVWRLYREECASGRQADEDPARAAAILAEYAQRATQAQADAERAAEREAQSEREAHTAAAEAAQAAWEAATPAEASHPYLIRKRLSGAGLRVATAEMRARLYSVSSGRWINRAIVVRAGDLLVPMHDADGVLVNLEKIQASGDKRGIAGGQRVGAWYTIPGAGVDSRRTACEGYATGAAWAEATGDAVAVSFSAGNLPAVAAAFGAQFVAADHDPKGAGERAAQKTGLPYAIPERVGDWWDVWALDGAEPLREAARIAIAAVSVPAFPEPWKLPAPDQAVMKGRTETLLHRLAKTEDSAQTAAFAWAIAIRLSAGVPHSYTVDSLIERVRIAAPVMNPRTLIAIKREIERRVEWRKARALAPIRVSDSALRRHRVEYVDEIPELSAPDFHGVILLSAPLGSGKTQRAGGALSRWCADEGVGLLAVAHRRGLVAELARRLNLEQYDHVSAAVAPYTDRLSTCVNSLTNPAHAGPISRAGFVFLDEVSQLIRAIAAGTKVAGKRGTADMLAALRRIVSEAECVMAVDAGLDDRTVKFIEACRPGEKARIIVMKPQDEGLQATFGVGPDSVASAVGEVLARLGEGQRIWIATAEMNRAEELANLLRERGNRVLLLHGKNGGDNDAAKFWSNPEAVSREFDAVVASPVIGSGISIEHRDHGPRFDHVTWIGGDKSVTPADALQSLRRVRYVRSFTVAVVSGSSSEMDSEAEMIEGMTTASELSGDAGPIKDHERLVIEIKASENRARRDMAGGLWWCMEHAGFRLQRAGDGDGDSDGEDDTAVSAELKAIRSRLREEKIEAITSARVLGFAEAMQLRDRAVRSEADELALQRWRISDDLALAGAEEVDRAAIDLWDDGRAPRAADRWSAAVLGLGDCRADPEDLHRRRYPRAKVAAYSRLIGDLDMRPGVRFSKEDAEAFMRRVMRDRELLAWLRIVPARYGRAVAPKPGAYPAREFGEVLALMGLQVKARRSNAKAPMGARLPVTNKKDGASCTQKRQIVRTTTWYEIDVASWSAVESLASRRNAARPHVRDLRELGPAAQALSRFGSAVAAVRIGAAVHSVRLGASFGAVRVGACMAGGARAMAQRLADRAARRAAA